MSEKYKVNKDKYDIVEVMWFDAQTYHETELTIDDIKKTLKPCLSFSVGYLIHKTKDFIVISCIRFDDSFKHIQVIPKGMIKKINILKGCEKL